jgi:hypothetical protein
VGIVLAVGMQMSLGCRVSELPAEMTQRDPSLLPRQNRKKVKEKKRRGPVCLHW